MSNATDYKSSKEAFVSGMTGSSIAHINMLSLASPMSILLYFLIRRILPNHSLALYKDFVILVVPLLVSITFFAETPMSTVKALLPWLLWCSWTLFARRENAIPLPSSRNPVTPSPSQGGISQEEETPTATREQLAPLTVYRSQMLLLTMLCILAVDFPIFPRSLAKCEDFGVSLMDLGVGSFVFSQGIVSAAPIVKDPAHLKMPLTTKVLAVAWKCLPVVVLGLLRTLSVKGMEYPEHVTEYGVHWNFFITLAILPILQALLHPLMTRASIVFLGVAAGTLHQVLLNKGLMDYIFSAPRVGIVSANKEGLVSLTGYLAIHLLGLSIGTLILPPTPSHFRRRIRELRHGGHGHRSSHSDEAPPSVDIVTPAARENDKTAIELCSYAVLWWTVLGALQFFNVGGGISRRLVNVQYIVWVTAYNTTFLLCYVLLDLAFFSAPHNTSYYSPVSKLKVRPDPALAERRKYAIAWAVPPLLAAVNKNGLALFVLANLATGLVNMILPTMYMSNWLAFSILLGYAFGIAGLAWKFRHKRLVAL